MSNAETSQVPQTPASQYLWEHPVQTRDTSYEILKTLGGFLINEQAYLERDFFDQQACVDDLFKCLKAIVTEIIEEEVANV